jgi:hypothetical protein
VDAISAGAAIDTRGKIAEVITNTLTNQNLRIHRASLALVSLQANGHEYWLNLFLSEELF